MTMTNTLDLNQELQNLATSLDLPDQLGGVPIVVEKRNGVSSRWIGDHQP